MVEVDLKNKTYRVSTKFLGVKFPGVWYTLPKYEYISVFKTNGWSVSMNNRRGGVKIIYTYEIRVNFVKNKEVNTVFETSIKKQAFKVAKEFAELLGGVRILDSTKIPVKWLDEK